MLPHPLPRQNRLQRLRSRDQNVRRATSLKRPRAKRSVTVPHLNPYIQVPAHLLQTTQQVPVQRPQRRNIQDGNSTGLLLIPSPQKHVQDRKDRRQGLACSRGRYQQYVLVLENSRNRQLLYLASF